MTDNFVWYELCCTDLEAAEDFYGAVIGWTSAPFEGAGAAGYRIFRMGDAEVAGLMPLPEGMSTPFWLGYIGVADADAATAQAAASGATIQRLVDVPEVGKIGLISDPQGVGYAVIQAYSDRTSEAFDQQRFGHGNWNELSSPDADGALAYYSALHGWTRGQTMPMGPMGDYQLVQADGADIGAIMPAPAGAAPSWLYYFGVTDIDAAVERITEKGGTVLHGPSQVPGGVWIVQFADPQGARAAVVGPKA
ncbi:VOC family protein [Sphingomonas sp.]|uniref:VOC family protein n=1 Tax=Sphingomonas sp. TaxID=28214 RepID=UPI003B3AE0EA